MTFRWRGDVVECRTPVMFEGDHRLQKAEKAAAEGPASGYSTEINVFKPQPVELDVQDRELVCRQRAVAVTKKRRRGSNSRSAERGRVYDSDPSEVQTVQELVQKNVCSFETIARHTTRYDYEVKLGFVPPDWAHFAQNYADGKIVAGAPRCYLLAEGEVGKQPEYRLIATAYHTGAVKTAMPTRLPSRGMVEAQWMPGASSEATCLKILAAAKKSRDGAVKVEGHCGPQERMNNLRTQQNGLRGEEEIVEEE
jgi:hypothetical protein